MAEPLLPPGGAAEAIRELSRSSTLLGMMPEPDPNRPPAPPTWRDQLSDPPKLHTLPDMIRLALDMAAEDASSARELREDEYSDTSPEASARTEFEALAGFDLYDRIRACLPVLEVEG